MMRPFEGIKTIDRAIANMIKVQAKRAGLDPSQFAGHSLRLGFVNEAGRRGIPAAQAQALTGHKSSAVLLGYYQVGDVFHNEAGKTLGMAG